MDHRSPLRDLTSFNIPDYEIIDMEKSNDNIRKKPRFSVIKAFDPLYNSPGPITVDISSDSNDSVVFQDANNDNFNDENINPRYSNLIEVIDASQDSLINDAKALTEDIINEALDRIFAKGVKIEKITELNETKEFITTPELLQIKQECDNHSIIEQLEIIIKENEEELASLRNELFEIKPEYEALKQKVKAFEEEITMKDDKLGNYIKTVGQLEIFLKSKDDDLAKLQDEISKMKPLYEETKLRVIEYKDAKEKAEEEVAKHKTELQLSAAKVLEHNEKNLQEKNTIQELQDLVLKKDEEINTLNQMILINEQEYSDLELKIKEYEDILESQAELLRRATAELETLKEENQWAKKHLSNQEIAFGDVYDKYERCKKIIEGYKINEEVLKNNTQMFQDMLNRYEEQREAMKQVADARYIKWEKDIEKVKEDYRSETGKLLKKIKHLEIKNSSLVSALEQKTQECHELTELCQEITEKC